MMKVISFIGTCILLYTSLCFAQFTVHIDRMSIDLKTVINNFVINSTTHGDTHMQTAEKLYLMLNSNFSGGWNVLHAEKFNFDNQYIQCRALYSFSYDGYHYFVFQVYTYGNNAFMGNGNVLFSRTDEQYIDSHQYVGLTNYSDAFSTESYIEATRDGIYIESVLFDTEPEADVLTIYYYNNGAYHQLAKHSGRTQFWHFTKYNKVKLNFTTDGRYTHSGFRLYYQSVSYADLKHQPI